MPRPKQYDDALRARLIAQAADALAEGGPDALSLRAVAAGAGTSTNAVYTLFGDKVGLVEATIAAAMDSFGAAQNAVLQGEDGSAPEAATAATAPTTTAPTTTMPTPTAAPGATQRLRRLGHAYRDWALAHPTLFAVAFGPKATRGECADLDRAQGAGFQPLLGVVTDLMAVGVFRAGDAEQVALSVWAATHGAVALELAQWPGAPWAAAFFDRHIEAIERAWVAPGPTG